MSDTIASRALTLVDQRRFQELADYCGETIKRLTDSGSAVDPRLYACQAIAAAHFGFFDRAKELLQMVWRHKRTILKWGLRGIRFIMLIATLIAFPDRIDSAIQRMSDLMREV
jgi:hypothetical protein